MPDHFYVYPTYLEKAVPRSGGRRVPDGDALVEPTAEEIVAAAKRLGYRAEVEVGKEYPRRPYVYRGRVKVAKRAGTSKAKFLHAVSTELQRMRQASGKK